MKQANSCKLKLNRADEHVNALLQDPGGGRKPL
jgi:hypothetical protein